MTSRCTRRKSPIQLPNSASGLSLKRKPWFLDQASGSWPFNSVTVSASEQPNTHSHRQRAPRNVLNLLVGKTGPVIRGSAVLPAFSPDFRLTSLVHIRLLVGELFGGLQLCAILISRPGNSRSCMMSIQKCLVMRF